MNRVQFMREQSQTTAVNFKTFMSVIKNNQLPVCFEGKDVKYYRSRIEQYLTENFGYISCNGKSKVLELRQKISQNPQYRGKLCLYFVDCDFDDNSDIHNQDDVYITPCYSIENLYISDGVFEKILSDEFSINQHNENQEILFNRIKSLFKERKKEFLQCIEEFNYYVYLIKLNNKNNISYQDIKISNLVDLNLNQVTKKYHCISEIIEGIDLDSFDLSIAVEYFLEKDHEKYFRGKNNFNFLEAFLSRLKDDATQKNISRVVFPKKQNIEFTNNNLLSTASKYAETPQCLIDFLKKYKPLLEEEKTN